MKSYMFYWSFIIYYLFMAESNARREFVTLTTELAIEIYALKMHLHAARPGCLSKCLKRYSFLVAEQHNVTAKKVRDIWNRKTWVFATSQLWSGESSN